MNLSLFNGVSIPITLLSQNNAIMLASVLVHLISRSVVEHVTFKCKVDLGYLQAMPKFTNRKFHHFFVSERWQVWNVLLLLQVPKSSHYHEIVVNSAP